MNKNPTSADVRADKRAVFTSHIWQTWQYRMSEGPCCLTCGITQNEQQRTGAACGGSAVNG